MCVCDYYLFEFQLNCTLLFNVSLADQWNTAAAGLSMVGGPVLSLYLVLANHILRSRVLLRISNALVEWKLHLLCVSYAVVNDKEQCQYRRVIVGHAHAGRQANNS